MRDGDVGVDRLGVITRACDHGGCDHTYAPANVMRARCDSLLHVHISRGAKRAVDQLNERYLRSELACTFAPHAHSALLELEKTSVIPNACVESVVRVVEALTAKSSEAKECKHGGHCVLHLWRRSDALNRLLGSSLRLEERFALIELATLVCIEQSWIGRPAPLFRPLQEPWWAFLNAIVAAEMLNYNSSLIQRWREIIAYLRKSPVDGTPLSVSCALAWCGIVDVERGELIDDDFANAACKERRWFTVNRGYGLRLLGQLFLIWDGTNRVRGVS